MDPRLSEMQQRQSELESRINELEDRINNPDTTDSGAEGNLHNLKSQLAAAYGELAGVSASISSYAGTYTVGSDGDTGLYIGRDDKIGAVSFNSPTTIIADVGGGLTFSDPDTGQSWFKHNDGPIQDMTPAFFTGAQIGAALLRPTPVLPVPNFGRKLNFLFGKSGGKNATRSQDMAQQLENIGIKDTAENRQYVMDQLTKAFQGPASSAARDGAVWRETVLIGPDGGAIGLNTLWRGNQLVTIIVKSGTGG